VNLSPDAGLGLAATAVLGFTAFFLRLVSRSGLIGGLAVGAVISIAFGWRGFAILALFFALGSGATRLSYATKAAEGTAQDNRGARGARHALANGACGVLLAAWSVLVTDAPGWVPVAFVGSFAAALCDTMGTEIGQAYGRVTLLPTTLRRVQRGTAGAISLEGTGAGAAAAVALGLFGVAIGFLGSWSVGLTVGAAGFLGALLESYAGALGLRRLGGSALNFANTVVGAALAVAITAAIGGAST